MKWDDVQAFVAQTARDAVQVMRTDPRYWMSVPFYAYYIPADGNVSGKVRFFADQDTIPAGYRSIRAERVGYGETVQQTVSWLVEALWNLPILPVD